MLEGLTPAPNRTVYCKVAQIADGLEDKDKSILLEAVNDVERWSANGLATALRQRGLSMADTTITKHRNKACACFRLDSC